MVSGSPEQTITQNKRPDPPSSSARTWRLPIGLVGAWIALVLSAAGLERLTGRAIPTCLFKRVTGLPCVGCGSTRGVLSAARGDFMEAWLYNPLVMTMLVAAPVWLLVRMRRDSALDREGRRRVPWSPAQRTVAWIVGIGLFTANWAFVLWRGN